MRRGWIFDFIFSQVWFWECLRISGQELMKETRSNFRELTNARISWSCQSFERAIPRVQFANDRCSCLLMREGIGDQEQCTVHSSIEYFAVHSAVQLDALIMLTYIEFAQGKEIYLNFLLSKDTKVPSSIWELNPALQARSNCSNSANLLSKHTCTSLKCSICKVCSKTASSQFFNLCAMYTHFRFDKKDFWDSHYNTVRSESLLIWIEALTVTGYN